MFQPLRLPLAIHIAAAMAVLVLLTSATSISLILGRLDALLIEGKAADLEREAQLQAVRFTSEIEEMQRDVLFLAGVPPIQALIQAERSGDRAEQEAWRGHLEVIFTELLRSKPDYLQARYIGIADGGRELVRVDRPVPGAEPRRVPRGGLQQKGGRAYMAATSLLGAGGLYLSAIDLNQEGGQIVTPWQPVVRAATPIFDGDGRLYGVVVINYDMQRGLEELAEVVDPNHTYYLVNQDGHYLAHPDPSQTFAFERGAPPSAVADFSSLARELSAAPSVRSEIVAREGGAELVSIRTVRLGPAGSRRTLGVVVADSVEDITTISDETWRQLSLIILGLLVVAIGTGVWLARRISRPIRALTEAVEADRGALPEDLSGEAGVLAGAIGAAWRRQRQHAAALEASNRELEQFAYIASHDLQEPLRTITSFVAALEEDFGPQLDPEARQYIGFIVRSCGQMRALIHGLLEYSRLDGRADVSQPVDCQALVASIAEDLSASIEAAGAELRFDGLPVVSGDPVGLRMLFQNLLSNAIKYRRPGVAPIVQIDARRDGARWRFVVSDNGLGIPPAHRERVFRIFQRLHTQDEIGGTGIGLALCRKIIGLHQGQVQVDEGPMGGAAFHFDLGAHP